MTRPRHIAVIDIGKTNAKLAVVDLNSISELAVVTRPNEVQPGPPWPHFDTNGHWQFLLAALTEFHRAHGIDGISVTTHGASIVLLTAEGDLAAPILDYEHNGPLATAEDYDAIRPSFADTGSPRLTNGLNVGAQLHWQFFTDPNLHKRTAHILTYPQYWAHRLTGVIASDLSSIGCHTDLWLPHKRAYSPLVDALDIVDKMAPVRKSNDILGSILPKIAAKTGLPPETPVMCGIHDSNASLYPHVLTQTAPYSVVSTGTWVIAMSVGGAPSKLNPARDTLINISASGDPVPSARFMGGREFELIQQGHPLDVQPKDIEYVLDKGIMLMPAVDPSSGPYQDRDMKWLGAEPAPGSGARTVALSFYLALMTNTCLDLTGASGPTIVEGPFASNSHYLTMLEAMTERLVLKTKSMTGTSMGAAMLFGSPKGFEMPTQATLSTDLAPLKEYAHQWNEAVAMVDLHL